MSGSGGGGEVWEAFRASVGGLRLSLPPSFEDQVRWYLAELARWNRVARLTAYGTERERLDGLVLSSLLFLRVLPRHPDPLLDIGSGAGAPGLLLKLARPDWVVTLVEANRRRANFLRHCARSLGPEGLAVEWARAEALAGDPAHAGRYRTVTCRAVAPPQQALALGRPFLAANGIMVLALGPRAGGAWPGEGRTGSPWAGRIREVAYRGLDGLSRSRRFLIIAAEQTGSVPRGTGGGTCGPGPRGGEPEGRSGEDHDRGEPGGGPGRG